MTVLWTMISFVSLSVSALIFHSLTRTNKKSTSARKSFDLAVYKDQLSELERDFDRGLLTENEVTAARTEIERRILLIAETEIDVFTPNKKTTRPLFAFGIALAIPTMALVLYIFLGSPHIPTIPYAKRDISAEKEILERQRDFQKARSLARRLERNLKNNSNNTGDWILLSRSYTVLGRHLDASNALEKAYKLNPNDQKVLVAYAESLIVTENNTITEEIKNLLNEALDANPRDPKVRYYLALEKAQKNDVHGAMQDWIDLIATAPKAAPWLQIVQSQIKAAADELGINPNKLKPRTKAFKPASPSKLTLTPGPTNEDIAAASKMSNAERQKMIRGMVERLASRLKQNPNDPVGWNRLAHAYRVLGEVSKAAEAEASAKATNR